MPYYSYNLGTGSNLDALDTNLNNPFKPKVEMLPAANPAKDKDTNIGNGTTNYAISNPWKYFLFVGAFIFGAFIAKMTKKR